MSKTVHELFEEAVAAAPGSIAIEYKQHQVSYKALQQWMNKVSTACLDAEPAHRGVVMVLLPKGPELVFSMLGIFKAGKVFLPVSWKMGEKIWKTMLHEIQPSIIITCEEELAQLKQMVQSLKAPVKYILLVNKNANNEYCIYSEAEVPVVEKLKEPAVTKIDVKPNDAAYIYCSSGTTGTPKIIEGNHKSLAHFIEWQVNEFNYTHSTRVSQFAAVTFDASLKDMLPPLISGGTLCIPDGEELADSSRMLQWIMERELNIMATVPSVFRALLAEIEAEPERFVLPALKYCLLAGEKLYNKDVYRWQQFMGLGTTLVNLYGATESTILKTYYRIDQAVINDASGVSVGKPIPGATVFIINEQHQICEAGEEGEVYIKTDFLTNGYWRDAAATRKIFVPNPLTGNAEDIVYRTGDYGRFLPDGNLVILGRKDSQVKIRGVRIDLSGIESVLLNYRNNKQVKCIVRATDDGEPYTVCYVVADSVLDESGLKDYCSKELSAFEVPDHFVILPAFPINAHGKLDIAALPEPFQKTKKECVDPLIAFTATELKMKEIWQDLLKQPGIGLQDSFFATGGDSLKAIQLGALIKRKMNREIGIAGIQQLFERPTLKEFCAWLDKTALEKQLHGDAVIKPALARASYPLSFAQYQVWIACQHRENNIAYNMQQSFRISGAVNILLLRDAIDQVVARHEILRTAFVEEKGQPVQIVLEALSSRSALAYYDLVNESNKLAKADAHISECTETPFELSEPALFRVLVQALDQNEYVLTLCMHHIIGDSWSAGIFAGELVTCYNSLKQGTAHKLPIPSIQYKDYVMFERTQLQGERMQELESFWIRHLGAKLPVLQLPVSRERELKRSTAGGRYEFHLPADALSTLNNFAGSERFSVFSLMLSAWYITLFKYSNNEEIIVGIPVATRSLAQLTDQLGLYVNTIALKATIHDTLQVKDFLRQTNSNLQQGFAHQLYPFHELVKKYNAQRIPGHNAVFDVAINMVTTGRQPIVTAADDFLVADWNSTSHVRSKFDLTLYVYDDHTQPAHPFIEYNAGIFDENAIVRLAVRYSEILSKIIRQPDRTIGEIIHEKISLPAISI